jgi:tRNA 5-methylaminomethyl-2-thiouridine biosynthesis bifunctional protein
MTGPAAAVLHPFNGLPPAGPTLDAWRVLDTRFDHGLHFLRTWQAWLNQPAKLRLLHYVALCANPPSLDALRASAAPYPELQTLVSELAPHWFGLLAGFNRLTLADEQLRLTLCVGDLTTMLREQQFVADAVYLDSDLADPTQTAAWSVWNTKALARCCRRGTRIQLTTPTPELLKDLAQSGFEIEGAPTGIPADALQGQFNPRWVIKNSREPALGQAATIGTCAVIGAGLAGASVAAALAQRGWQVQVLDQGPAPATGASGLPVGLVVPHVSSDDCALSRLSRSGVRLMMHHARRLLRQGLDWDASGTMERRVDGTPGLSTTATQAEQDWSRPGQMSSSDAPWSQDIPADQAAVWHAQAAWLKPAQLVHAWLAQPGVTFQANAHVTTLRPNGDGWELQNDQGVVLACANRVVFANAHGALPLLKTLQASQPELGLHIDQWPAMHGVRGLLSWAMHPGTPEAAFPPFPVNGAGSVIPAVPVEGAAAWFIGSSYQPDNKPESPDAKNQAANLGRLQKLLPRLGQLLAPRFMQGSLNTFKSTRCTTADRLPLVGPLYNAEQPSLWICAGMGSRGLSFSGLCAELLAARWGAEPLPLDAALAQSLDPLRGQQALVAG